MLSVPPLDGQIVDRLSAEQQKAESGAIRH
jgi:hypothetical protein